MKYFYFLILLCLFPCCYAEEFIEKPIPLSLSSPAFEHGSAIPMTYTCDGKNISPPLAINNVSKRAQSLMLVAVDKESSNAPYQAVIWFVYNIPPQTKFIDAGHNNNDSSSSYQSPCPKGETHHYYFNLYAIDKSLPESTKTLEDASSLIKDHLVGYASLMGTYSRR